MKEEEYFYLKDGRALKSIEEFYDALDSISEEDFNSHVSEEKNDFAEWVRHVFKSEHLADELSKVKTKEDINNVLEIYLGIAKVSDKVLEGTSVKESGKLVNSYLDNELSGVRKEEEENINIDHLIKKKKLGFFERLFKRKKKDEQ